MTPPAPGQIAGRIANTAFNTLLDHDNHRLLRATPCYDVLRYALPGWQQVAMLDLTGLAKQPVAWFLFHHPDNGWWTTVRLHVLDLNHPYPGQHIFTHFLTTEDLTAAEDLDAFITTLFDTTTDLPSGHIATIHADWALAAFPDNPQAQGYRTLLALART